MNTARTIQEGVFLLAVAWTVNVPSWGVTLCSANEGGAEVCEVCAEGGAIVLREGPPGFRPGGARTGAVVRWYVTAAGDLEGMGPLQEQHWTAAAAAAAAMRGETQ